MVEFNAKPLPKTLHNLNFWDKFQLSSNYNANILTQNAFKMCKMAAIVFRPKSDKTRVTLD